MFGAGGRRPRRARRSLRKGRHTENSIDHYYTRQTRKLLQEFDKTVRSIGDVLLSRYGAAEADALIQEARREYEALIPQLPYVGGVQPLTQFVVASGWFLALYRVLQRRGGTLEEAGQLMYDLSAATLKAQPGLLRRVFGHMSFSRRYVTRLRQRAEYSHRREHPGDYVFNFVEGDGQRFDYGVDYVQCATLQFLTEQGAAELAPYLCALDALSSDAFGWGLQRTMTLAQGDPVCDFRFKRGAPTRVPLPDSLRDKQR